ncbi:MAG: type IX secretion system membrane protein PorP/SprF [Bacteroidales bacterium]
MLKKFTFIIAILILILSGKELRSQDPHFSQFYANPLYLNPAFAGSNICPRLTVNYRNQWPAITGAYVTYNAGYDQYFDKIGGGLGLLATADRSGEGVLNSTHFSFMYAYRLEVSNNFHINAGLQATYFQKSVDWNKLTFGDQIDPKWGFVNQTNEPSGAYESSGPDFSAGLLGYTNNLYVGFAVHHLTEPDEGFRNYSELPMKYTGHAGFHINLSGGSYRHASDDDPTLSPNLMYQQQGDFHQINYGMYFNAKPIVAGMWFRQFFEGSDALVVLAGFEYKKFKFGYSYDITVSKLSDASGGAHEVSMGLEFNCPPQKKKLHKIECPTF